MSYCGYSQPCRNGALPSWNPRILHAYLCRPYSEEKTYSASAPFSFASPSTLVCIGPLPCISQRVREAKWRCIAVAELLKFATSGAASLLLGLRLITCLGACKVNQIRLRSRLQKYTCCWRGTCSKSIDMVIPLPLPTRTHRFQYPSL